MTHLKNIQRTSTIKVFFYENLGPNQQLDALGYKGFLQNLLKAFTFRVYSCRLPIQMKNFTLSILFFHLYLASIHKAGWDTIFSHLQKNQFLQSPQQKLVKCQKIKTALCNLTKKTVSVEVCQPSYQSGDQTHGWILFKSFFYLLYISKVEII